VPDKNKIKVLVVDESLIFREVIKRGLSIDPLIDVVATAKDAYDACDKILEYKPDVMTCDIQLPKMSGIEFIRRLLPQYPLPVIIVSAVSRDVFNALNAGAIEFVAKPNIDSSVDVKEFLNNLNAKIKIASTVKVTQERKTEHSNGNKTENNEFSSVKKLIAIGASTGGTEAIYSILKALPPSVPGIVVVQHIPPVFSRMFAERLNTTTNLAVKEAENGDFLETGKVLIAPGNKHMRVKKIGDRFKVECFHGEKVNGHCPSVDILFESVAKEAGDKALGIILTGMGHDGAKGLYAMKRKGAITIGQDEKSSVVYGMPKVAYEMGAVMQQAPLDVIPQLIFMHLKEDNY